MLVGEVDGEKCGMIRFDRIESEDNGSAQWSVSIALDRMFRGRRLGYALLSIGCAELNAGAEQCEFVADVRITNSRSKQFPKMWICGCVGKKWIL